jgi:hypothetical protein
MKRISFAFILTLFYLNSFAQSNNNIETTDLAIKLIDDNNGYIVDSTTAKKLTDYQFLGYKKIEFEKCKHLPLTFVKYVVVNTIVDRNEQEFIKDFNSQRISQYSEELLNRFPHKGKYNLSNLKFIRESGNSHLIISDSLVHSSNSKSIYINSIILNRQDFSTANYNNLEFRDNVATKLYGKADSTIYYLFSTNYGIALAKESDYLRPDSLIKYKYANWKYAIEDARLENHKKKVLASELYKKVFNKGNIYLYNAHYRSINHHSSSIKDSLIETSAISNIAPDKITTLDFPKSSELNLVDFEFIDSVDYSALLYNKSLAYGIIIQQRFRSTSEYRFWNKGESQDPLLDLEKDKIFSKPTLARKFDEKYFFHKIDSLFALDKLNNVSAPRDFLFAQEGLPADRYKLKLGFASEENEIGSKFELNFTNEKFELKQTSSPYGHELFPYITKKFDLRVDTADYNFVIVDEKYFFDFKEYEPEIKFFGQGKYMKAHLSKYLSNEISGFYDYLRKNNSEVAEIEKTKFELSKKYGAKFVNEALEGNIIIGMHEDLLPIPLKLWKITSRSLLQNGYRIVCISLLDSSKKLYLTIINKKVTNLSY